MVCIFVDPLAKLDLQRTCFQRPIDLFIFLFVFAVVVGIVLRMSAMQFKGRLIDQSSAHSTARDRCCYTQLIVFMC